jgi:hypothetical protein
VSTARIHRVKYFSLVDHEFIVRNSTVSICINVAARLYTAQAVREPSRREGHETSTPAADKYLCTEAAPFVSVERRKHLPAVWVGARETDAIQPSSESGYLR